MTNANANRLLMLGLPWAVETSGKLIAAFAKREDADEYEVGVIDLAKQIKEAGPEPRRPS